MVKEIQVEFTDKKVTAWGGMKLMKDMVDSIGIKEFMSGLDLPEKGSNRGYEAIQIIECFWTSIWIGLADLVIQRICVTTKCCNEYLDGSRRHRKARTVDFFKSS